MLVRNKPGYEFLSVTAGSHREDTLVCSCLAVVKVHQPAELFFSAFCWYVVNSFSKVPILWVFLYFSATEIALLSLPTNLFSLLTRIFQVQLQYYDNITPSCSWFLRQLVFFCVYTLCVKKTKKDLKFSSPRCDKEISNSNLNLFYIPFLEYICLLSTDSWSKESITEQTDWTFSVMVLQSLMEIVTFTIVDRVLSSFSWDIDLFFLKWKQVSTFCIFTVNLLLGDRWRCSRKFMEITAIC